MASGARDQGSQQAQQRSSYASLETQPHGQSKFLSLYIVVN